MLEFTAVSSRDRGEACLVEERVAGLHRVLLLGSPRPRLLNSINIRFIF